jgi:fucose 4-O-acetylase-like acetyltransferase
MKGLLIACIVLGHNSVVTIALPGLWTVLYTFHVSAFLLLPFLHPSPAASRRFALDRAVRYGVPFVAFFLFAAALNTIMFRRGDPPVQILHEVAWGLIVTTFTSSRDATGFALYWFLPTLYSLVVLRALWASCTRACRTTLLVILLAVHGTLGALPDEIRNLIPLGLPIVVYIFPLGLLASWLWRRLCVRHLPEAAAGAGAIALVAMVAFLLAGGRVNLASLNLYTLARPIMQVLADTIAVAAFLAIAAFSPVLSRIGVLRWLGRGSLVVYLTHSIVFQALLRFAPNAWVAEPGSAKAIATGLILFVGTLLLSGFLAEALERTEPARRLLLPRTWSDWRPTAAWTVNT